METSAKGRDMTAAASLALRGYAASEWPLLNHKGRLTKLCRMLPWTDRRVRSVYNGERGVSLRADEQAAIDNLIHEARHEYDDLQTRIARLEALLLHQDEAFHSPSVAAFRQGAGGGR